MKIKVGVSNRHIHLTEEVYHKLFDEPLTKKSDLHQIGEFASNQVVTVKTNVGEIKNVRIVGPFRTYNQVEILKSDAFRLKINPPYRCSGDVKDSASVILKTEKGEVFVPNCCILSERHVHMNADMAKSLGVVDKQQVKIMVSGDKAGILYAKVKVSENGYCEVHLDLDDANAMNLQNGDEVELIV